MNRSERCSMSHPTETVLIAGLGVVLGLSLANRVRPVTTSTPPSSIVTAQENSASSGSRTAPDAYTTFYIQTSLGRVVLRTDIKSTYATFDDLMSRPKLTALRTALARSLYAPGSDTPPSPESAASNAETMGIFHAVPLL